MSVDILHYSDIEYVYDYPDRISSFARTIDELRSEGTVLTGGGDYTGPGVLSLRTRGRQAVELFESLRPSFETFGNHDFDYGSRRAREIVDASPQQWLCCNVRDASGEPFGHDVGVDEYTVKDYDDRSVGFYGLAHPETGDIQSRADELRFEDPIESAKNAIQQLADEKADVIIALSHCGEGDERLARETRTDVVLGGHEHDGVTRWVDGTVLVRPLGRGRDVVELVISEDDIRVNTHPVSVTSAKGPVRETFHSLLADHDLTETVDHLETPVERPEADGLGSRAPILGDFLTSAFQWAGDTDVAVCTSGALREGPPLDGDITIRDIVSLAPFEERVVVARMTGEQLERMVSAGHGRNNDLVDTDEVILDLAGGTVSYDHGSITELIIGDGPVDPDAEYSIATSEYLVETDVLGVSEATVVDRLGLQYEHMTDYARKYGVIETPT